MKAELPYFMDVGHEQMHKRNQMVCGDVFLSIKVPEQNRVVSVLADGLGSGIKASVLATLTSTMAARLTASDIDVRKTANIITETLPVCKVRKIGYSTFTIIDLEASGKVRIVEYDNPPFVLLRKSKAVPVQKDRIRMKGSEGRDINLYYSTFQLESEDRIVFCSDGVTQSGIGFKQYPLGWGQESLEQFLIGAVERQRDVSARSLSRGVVRQAHRIDHSTAADDISCGVIYCRKPRKTLVITGPPINQESDGELAKIVRENSGKKILCGGTTALILSRELDVPIEMDLLTPMDPNVPPAATMAGFDLVTEGTLTLGFAANLLEGGMQNSPPPKPNAAFKLVTHLLDSDIIEFVVGTRINHAHQDPSMPYFLEIRRNVVHKISTLLKEKYLKETHVRFI